MAMVLRLNRTRQASREPIKIKISHNDEEITLLVQWEASKRNEVEIVFDGPKSFVISRNNYKREKNEAILD